MMRARTAAVVGLVGLASVVVITGFWAAFPRPSGEVDTPPGPAFQVTNVTAQLGDTFVNGAPQAFGWNGTETLVTGVVGNPPANAVPFPLLGALGGTTASADAINLTQEVTGLFHGGVTLGLAWNGSTWLITGEAAWGTFATGAAAYYSNGVWTNLTPLLGPYFSGVGGIWFDAWNGSAWLIGGNSTSGAALVALQGSAVQDLTGLIPNNRPVDWIQYVQWNGTAWLVGGYGVFGVVRGNSYTDLYPGSEFTGGGVYAADWNGSAWLVGGGAPAAVETLRGSSLSPGPALAPAFRYWVNGIAWDGNGWYIGGAGESPGDFWQADLEYLPAGSGGLFDLSATLPSAFWEGEVQYLALAPWYGPHVVLLVGQGGLGPETAVGGPSHGAAATVVRG